MRGHTYSIDEARRFAMRNGIKPCRNKSTGRYEFLKTITQDYEQVTWEELKKDIDEKGLVLLGDGMYLKVSRFDNGML